jgi:hypothetical protein
LIEEYSNRLNHNNQTASLDVLSIGVYVVLKVYSGKIKESTAFANDTSILCPFLIATFFPSSL